ncbi:MAG: type IIA DNA topoisomerase subunit B [Paludibacteraceae bacterium]|nr:type IIA DNA topoisomerase subunit B [Paludibacteraceae bacterium]
MSETDELFTNAPLTDDYTDDNIVHLEGLEHVRLRPGMYIGKLGDGSSADDGIYVLLKEVIDNSIDEFRMNCGKLIEITLEDHTVSVRDYGRGIPQGKLVDCVSLMNTGGKYDSKAFKNSVCLNGVGTKAVNALSSEFTAISYRDGMAKKAEFKAGKLVKEYDLEPTTERNGTYIRFTPDNDPKLFGNYNYRQEYIENMLHNYSYLNQGLTIRFNGQRYQSQNGLLDLLTEKCDTDPLYPIVHIKGEDIEIAFTHMQQYGEEYYSFVNGQHTTQGGTHQSAFREAFARTIKEFYNKNFEYSDIRSGIIASISISVEEPVFESQTKIKLGSKDMGKDGPSVAKYVGDFIKKEVDNYLHKHPDVAEILLKKIQEAESERKAMAGVAKLAREKAKKVSLHNEKLRDCRIHYCDVKNNRKDESSIFITEGNSASGSITKCRDVNTQAVFSLRGKPLNCYGQTKEVVYKNDEFNFLQAALDIEEGLDNLRYNKVIIATDADDDGMHIRMLMMGFFLQFFPELVKTGHVFILETPLFRVRNKKDTYYCYTDEERVSAIEKCGAKAEITRFKGLGEISPDEFKHFIGKDMRLDPVTLRKDEGIQSLLRFYLGENTPERQDFIINHLRIEEDRDEDMYPME